VTIVNGAGVRLAKLKHLRTEHTSKAWLRVVITPSIPNICNVRGPVLQPNPNESR